MEALRESVAESPEISTRPRDNESIISRMSLYRILTEDLSPHSHEV